MSNSTYWDGDIPWISAASLTSTRLRTSDRNVTETAIGNGTKIAPAGSTLLLVRGMSLHKEIRVGQATRDLAFNQDVKAFHPRDGIDPAFLLYSLDGRRAALLDLVHSAGHGTGVLATDRLKSLPLDVPPLAEQRRIASVLVDIDDLIETNRYQVVRLEELARAVAATAKRDVPLAEYARAAQSRQTKPVGRVEHYSLPAFDEGAVPEMVDGAEIQSSKLPLTAPCVLVSRLNPKWERCWMAYPGQSAVASTEFVPVIGEGASPEEVWAVASSSSFWEQMRTHVTGTTGSHQRVDKAAVLTLAVPDVRLLTRSTREQVAALVRGAHACRGEIADIVRVRDELLPVLMSGKVRVPEDLAVA